MEPILVDGEWLEMVPPEGFERIPHDELEKLMGFQYEQMLGMRDAERHMLICITWKDAPKLLGKLATEKTLAKRVNETMGARHMKDDYRSKGYFEHAVAGANALAHGCRFAYTVAGVGQEGEALVFKRQNRTYTLVYYTRPEVAEANRPIYDGIVASLKVR